jgi:hypothetical protein
MRGRLFGNLGGVLGGTWGGSGVFWCLWGILKNGNDVFIGLFHCSAPRGPGPGPTCGLSWTASSLRSPQSKPNMKPITQHKPYTLTNTSQPTPTP